MGDFGLARGTYRQGDAVKDEKSRNINKQAPAEMDLDKGGEPSPAVISRKNAGGVGGSVSAKKDAEKDEKSSSKTGTSGSGVNGKRRASSDTPEFQSGGGGRGMGAIALTRRYTKHVVTRW